MAPDINHENNSRPAHTSPCTPRGNLCAGNSLYFAASGITNAGGRCDQQEDACYYSATAGLFIVSDGIGGTQAGGLASQITVQALPSKILEACARRDGEAPEHCHARARMVGVMIDAVKEVLLEKTRTHPATKGLGATVVAAYYIGGGQMALSHLGDSRAYLLRNSVLERLTEDHTLANMLYLTGQITHEQMKDHPGCNILTRHIGMAECPDAEVMLLSIRPGDRLLLCTDGLTGVVGDAELGALLTCDENPAATCHALLAAAQAANAQDNITALVVDVLPRPGPINPGGVVTLCKEVGSSLTPLTKS